MRDVIRDEHDESLPSELAGAIEVLREAPAVRTEWRDTLLQQVAERPAPARRRLTLSIPWAIAAGVACALAGAGAMTLLRVSPAPTTIVATNPVVPAGGVMLPVRFSLDAPHAVRVSIVGDFNDWNPTTLPMRRSADGRVWEVEVRLPLGRYNYAFMVDGHLARDPVAPSTTDDDFGTANSVLMVRGS